MRRKTIILKIPGACTVGFRVFLVAFSYLGWRSVSSTWGFVLAQFSLQLLFILLFMYSFLRLLFVFHFLSPSSFFLSFCMFFFLFWSLSDYFLIPFFPLLIPFWFFLRCNFCCFFFPVFFFPSSLFFYVLSWIKEMQIVHIVN